MSSTKNSSSSGSKPAGRRLRGSPTCGLRGGSGYRSNARRVHSAELGNVDHLAHEVVVVQADPAARPQHAAQLREEPRPGRTSARPNNTSPRRTTRRGTGALGVREEIRAVRAHGAPRAASRATRRPRPRTSARSPSATVDMPVPHARSSARADRRVTDDRPDARERTRMMERAAAVVERTDARRRERVRAPVRRRRRHAGPPSRCGSACATRPAPSPSPEPSGNNRNVHRSSRIVGRDRHVARVGPAPVPRATRYRPMRRLYATRSMPRSAPSVAQLGRRLDPALGRDEEVALRRGGQLGGGPVAVGRRALLGRRRGTCHPRAACASPNCRLPRWSSTRSRSTRNLDTMTAALPGRAAASAREGAQVHRARARAGAPRPLGFTGATPRELLGLARAGLGDDLLLANESVDDDRLRALAECGARVTVAVDSEATVDAAARNGIREVLIDVNVGIPRCGVARRRRRRARRPRARARASPCAARWATRATRCSWPIAAERAALTDKSMATLAAAHEAVGGDRSSRAAAPAPST